MTGPVATPTLVPLVRARCTVASLSMRRRTFILAGLGAGGALVVGWALTPPRQRLRGSHPPETPEGAVALNGWVVIGADGIVTVVSPKAEMGQGITTALAMLVAEELDCRWEDVRVAPSPIDRIYGNIAVIVDGLPFHPDADGPLVRTMRWLTAKTMREMGVMMTGGSSSVRDCWQIAREAGATARAALVEAAAARAGVEVSACRAAQGRVVAGDRTFGYGELAADAAARRPGRVALKAPDAFTVIGRDLPRVDAAEKSRGAPIYGLDVRVEGIRYAAVQMAPVFGQTPVELDTAPAPGVHAVFQLEPTGFGEPAAVVAIADTWWQAREALRTRRIVWSESPHAALSSEAIIADLRAAAAEPSGLPFRSVGDAEEVLLRASQRIEATYEAPYLAHATMEPMNATVRVGDGVADCWVGTQVPAFARKAVATVLDLDPERVTLHQQSLGGGFGRRLDVDHIAQAAAIAKRMPGVAVQCLWSREDDLRHDFYRPAAVGHLRAVLGDAAEPIRALASHSASQAPFKSYSRRIGFALASAGPDKTTAEGTWDQPYEFPALRATHTERDLPVPVGSWRSVGHSHQAFFLESFLDECAIAAGRDPLEFRLAMLRAHPRAVAVLRLATERAGWRPDGAVQDGVAQGLALHWSFGSLVAQVAEVERGGPAGFRVRRIVSAIDCGLAVHPAGVRQQVEGAVIMGLTAALHGEVRITGGAAAPSNFHEQPLLRIDEVPVIETHIVPSDAVPSGVGEPGLPPVAPAVANALVRLTGVRLRTLPLRLPSAGPAA